MADRISGAPQSQRNQTRAKRQKGQRKLPLSNPFWARWLAAAMLPMMLPADSSAAETTIRLGNTAPYSGPASAYGTIARAEAAYFQMLNDEGGINGRKIDFLTLDDAYSPAKTVEQTRKLVEQDDVLAVFSSVGTAPNISVQKYLNAKRIPQLFVSSGATRVERSRAFPMDGRFQSHLRTGGPAMRSIFCRPNRTPGSR
jgi:ABC-type branched-subunit amino acid transport system substrate-binding protein